MAFKPTSHWRLIGVAGLVAALWLAFIPALEGAHIWARYSIEAHPWYDIRRDILIFALAATALVFSVPVAARGSAVHRVVAITLLVVPLYVLVKFLTWSLVQSFG